MSGIALFCIAQEALPFVRVVSGMEAQQGVYSFWLVDSQAGPPLDRTFRNKLGEDEVFHTDFIGASHQDCQGWMLDHQKEVSWMNHNFFVLLDARSADDNTVVVWKFKSRGTIWEAENFEDLNDSQSEDEDDDGEDNKEDNNNIDEVLLRGTNPDIWYGFRVDYKQIKTLFAHLEFYPPEMVDPVYFNNHDELTDENGIFDMDKADRLVSGEEELED
ncbi:hypothetical protein K461DRAFT_324551 [Myriangium duriaei CBS 260.36]|uniref:Uncharacterized protein n=1 Tax=Myriangium duriaei CBS 260.36 TaxID=1168546 RepID=A0A9P4MCU5_9PEZI|nr:hypothetical protein K461DRAFT_324551 [Myriangium duriaei CBS 260.36]